MLGPAFAGASGTPDLQLSGGPAASVLYGKQVPVDLTASVPAGQPKGYNLAFRAVLPAGTSYVPGSAGTLDGEPKIINNAPTSGKTTLIWPNVDDLVPASSHTLSFKVAYNDTGSAGTPKYDVGDLIPIDTRRLHLDRSPRRGRLLRQRRPDARAPIPTPATRSSRRTPQLTAIEVAKSEPHPEGEIPRGLHDHQTVYTLEVTNNGVNPTNDVSLEDYIPAGLEFLGCAGTPDHTTDAPTNPGSTDEYKGSGPIDVAHPTAAELCVEPDLVETVDLDPDGILGPLPAGVYTHVKWNDIGDFGPDGTRTIRYGAAIPIRENTTDWTGAVPNTTGQQTANLDNNSGPETYDEQPLLNGAIVAGTYQAPAKPGKAVSDEGTLLRTAEDIAIQKSNDLGSLNQGDITKWTLDLQTSEYRTVDDVVINDTLPNGLCPLGDRNYENPVDTKAECDPVAGKTPSPDYTDVNEQANGTYAISWDKSTVPALAHFDPSSTYQLSFYSRTRDELPVELRRHDADPLQGQRQQRRRDDRDRLHPARLRRQQDRPRRGRRRRRLRRLRLGQGRERPGAREDRRRTSAALGRLQRPRCRRLRQDRPGLQPRRPGLLEAAPRLPAEARHDQPGRLRHPPERPHLRARAARRPRSTTRFRSARSTPRPTVACAGRSAAPTTSTAAARSSS